MEYLIYFTIFFIPTYLIRFSVFGVPTNVLEILVGITAIAWLINKFKDQHPKAKAINNKPTALVIGIFLLAVGLVLGTLFSIDVRASLGALKSWFLVPLVFAAVVKSVLVTTQQKRQALYALAYSGAGVALVGLGYWLLGKFTFDGRLAAFYESPNMLAMYVVVAFLIVTQLLVQSSKLKVQSYRSKLKSFKFLIVVLSFALCASSLFLTRSVGAFIGIAGAIVAATLYARFQVWRKLWITFFVIVVITGFLLPTLSLFTNPWQAGSSSLASRFMVWQASFKIISQHWFFGIGPGTFQEAYLSQQKNFPPFLEWAIPHPHSIFLDTYLSAGLLGLMGLLLILAGFFSQLSKEKDQFVVSCLLLVVSYLLIHGAIDNTLWRNDMVMIFWLVLASV